MQTGTMVGSSWFADHEWDRLRQNAVGYVQIDQPGCVGTSEWSTGSNVELRRMHQAVEHEMLGGGQSIGIALPRTVTCPSSDLAFR